MYSDNPSKERKESLISVSRLAKIRRLEKQLLHERILELETTIRELQMRKSNIEKGFKHREPSLPERATIKRLEKKIENFTTMMGLAIILYRQITGASLQ